MTSLTAGEECQLAAKTLSSFVDPLQGAITPPFINSAMGIAIFKGDVGVAIVRLKSGEWSAPCAITCSSPVAAVQPAQDTVLLFMTEHSIFSLVGQSLFVLGQTHRFAPGPLYGSALNIDASVDVYAFVRFNNGFTPAELIQQYMTGWTVKEDQERHSKWHGRNATWFDVLTNKISVDRSSVGNALYLVLNLATSGAAPTGKNFAKIDEWALSHRQPKDSQSVDAQTLYQQQLEQQIQQQQQFQQQQQLQEQQLQQQLQLQQQQMAMMQQAPHMQQQMPLIGLGLSQPVNSMGMQNMSIPMQGMMNPNMVGMQYGMDQPMQQMMQGMPMGMMQNSMMGASQMNPMQQQNIPGMNMQSMQQQMNPNMQAMNMQSQMNQQMNPNMQGYQN